MVGMKKPSASAKTMKGGAAGMKKPSSSSGKAKKTTKAMKAMKTMKAMKAMKAKPRAKCAPKKWETGFPLSPAEPSFDGCVEVAQVDSCSSEIYCYVSIEKSASIADMLKELEKPGCDGVEMRAIGLSVTVEYKKKDDDGKKDDDSKKDDDREKDDDMEDSDGSGPGASSTGNSDRSGTSSSHWDTMGSKHE